MHGNYDPEWEDNYSTFTEFMDYLDEQGELPDYITAEERWDLLYEYLVDITEQYTEDEFYELYGEAA